MNRDDIIRMAWKAGFERLGHTDNDWVCYPEDIKRFANLVASAEREACAKVCEETTASWTQHLYNEGCIDCAKAIRARGEQA